MAEAVGPDGLPGAPAHDARTSASRARAAPARTASASSGNGGSVAGSVERAARPIASRPRHRAPRSARVAASAAAAPRRSARACPPAAGRSRPRRRRRRGPAARPAAASRGVLRGRRALVAGALRALGERVVDGGAEVRVLLDVVRDQALEVAQLLLAVPAGVEPPVLRVVLEDVREQVRLRRGGAREAQRAGDEKDHDAARHRPLTLASTPATHGRYDPRQPAGRHARGRASGPHPHAAIGRRAPRRPRRGLRLRGLRARRGRPARGAAPADRRSRSSPSAPPSACC